MCLSVVSQGLQVTRLALCKVFSEVIDGLKLKIDKQKPHEVADMLGTKYAKMVSDACRMSCLCLCVFNV